MKALSSLKRGTPAGWSNCLSPTKADPLCRPDFHLSPAAKAVNGVLDRAIRKRIAKSLSLHVLLWMRQLFLFKFGGK